jgi:hypothetical protein
MAQRSDELATFGHELDVKVSYQFWTYASIDLLYALFAPGELMSVGIADPIIEHFVYSTADVKF